MSEVSSHTVELAHSLTEELAGKDLPRDFARLYSQQTRLRGGREGLQSWTTDEALERLADVERLLEASEVQKDAGDLDGARTSMKRVAELLEWLSQPGIIDSEWPLGLMSAAAYQVAGYRGRKSIVWPSQLEGISQLANGKSFALCTPTGSGKTTVAELAIIHSLFSAPHYQMADEFTAAPLVLYLVPSRALAAEVEAKMSQVLQSLSTLGTPVRVTGLYGGTDWGPTDAWLEQDLATVLICTYEKAEALVRFLGAVLAQRVSLLIIDEAHFVQADMSSANLQTAENRSLRMESIVARLMAYSSVRNTRVVALSAVASGMEKQLAQWISSDPESSPVVTRYRSTRQLVGRLICFPTGAFRIYYDMLDGADVRISEGNRVFSPWVPEPIKEQPSAPVWNAKGARVGLRPSVLWAAIHLAAPKDEARRSVLISISQNIDHYTSSFLELLEKDWADTKLPTFFEQPTNQEQARVWSMCLQSCRDYFGEKSREYRLLGRGVAVHHGRMPGRLARLIVEAIQMRVLSVVVATSTLTDGVNLPFEIVLIPELSRYGDQGIQDLSPQEFANLVGRAGRPGYATEGQSLVVLWSRTSSGAWSDSERGYLEAKQRTYDSIINGLRKLTSESVTSDNAKSPLAKLLARTKRLWSIISVTDEMEDFIAWLEETCPPEAIRQASDEDEIVALRYLDSLDSIILSVLVELEQLSGSDMEATDLEEKLKSIWQKTYACYASRYQEEWAQCFVQRGIAIKNKIYPDIARRRQLYRSGLPPANGELLINACPEIVDHIKSGVNYSEWDDDTRFDFISRLVSSFEKLPTFAPDAGTEKRPIDWRPILRWWLNPDNAKWPKETQVSNWHKYVNRNFVYRLNWGIGCVLALAFDQACGDQKCMPSIADWPESGLPWIAFWLKELITWGTLDPAAAYLLERQMAVTREEARLLASEYYSSIFCTDLDASECLNPALIQAWTAASMARDGISSMEDLGGTIDIELIPGASPEQERGYVLPVELVNSLYWMDPFGKLIAKCPKPEWWKEAHLHDFDFVMDADACEVVPMPYL